MTPTEHITAAIAAIGCGVASTREVATQRVWGAVDVTLTDGRRLLADYGPAGVHAWRWPQRATIVDGRMIAAEWSLASATTAGDALAISDARRGAS